MNYMIRRKFNDDGEYIRLATLRLNDWYTTSREHADVFSLKIAIRVLNKTKRSKYEFELVTAPIIESVKQKGAAR